MHRLAFCSFAVVALVVVASALLAPARANAAPASISSPPDNGGIHLPTDPLTDADFAALEMLHPRSVVVLSAQLGEVDPLGQVQEDPRLEEWLWQHREVQPIVRLWPVKSPEPPDQLADRIAALHRQYPWISYFVPANEPDIEWGETSWQEIGSWTREVWEAVEQHPQIDRSHVRLLFPPFAQHSGLRPEQVGYDAVRSSLELYLNHGDGMAAHEYWDRDNVYLVEDQWPTWLRGRLRGIPFFVTECGRQPTPANGVADADLGNELVRFASRTQARVVDPFLLSSATGTFDAQALIDSSGVPRPALFGWAHRAPWS
jgi:hypothetical protein